MNKDAIYIDTNVFLRFLVVDEREQGLAIKAKKIFRRINNGDISVTTNICVISEIVYVLESQYEISKEKIAFLVIPLLSKDNVQIQEKDLVINSLMVYAEKNVDFEDAYTYSQMKNQEIRKVYTFDKKHFRRFENIVIVDK